MNSHVLKQYVRSTQLNIGKFTALLQKFAARFHRKKRRRRGFFYPEEQLKYLAELQRKRERMPPF